MLTFGEVRSIAKDTKQTASGSRAASKSAPEKVPQQPEVERLREPVLCGQLDDRPSEYDGVFENSPRMQAIKDMIDQVADTDVTVLVWGESGVGKELVARAIHDCSPRRERPFVKVNCAALPLELLESELFGYERGAFTGAHKRKPGKFELADGGTIFLDEIGEMPLPLQAKLLHVLQDGAFARLGGGHEIKVNVRVVASTNKDLEQAVAHGGFREDLYYRLNVVNILVPPLRERSEEIPILAELFCQIYAIRYKRKAVHVSQDLLDRFQAHAWPGNVRELENLVKRLVVHKSEELVAQGLPMRTTTGAGEIDQPSSGAFGPPEAEAFKPAAWVPGVGLQEFARRAAQGAERIMIKQVLEDVRWNRVEAGRRLKISYKALLYKIQRYELAASGPTQRKRGAGEPTGPPKPACAKPPRKLLADG
jgi:transcriptional regulator with GAF, ATPase, and Fis domain